MGTPKIITKIFECYTNTTLEFRRAVNYLYRKPEGSGVQKKENVSSEQQAVINMEHKKVIV